jgi:hypothetical protein
LKFSADDWKEIIQPVGMRRYVGEQVQKIIKEEEKAALSQLVHCRGLPKKPVEEKAQLVPQARITSFFKKSEVLQLPDDVPSILPEVTDDTHEQVPLESATIVTEKNISSFIQYML